jgi:hypothetical protein
MDHLACQRLRARAAGLNKIDPKVAISSATSRFFREEPSMLLTFDSASDLARALRRAADAYGRLEEQTGRPDVDWPDWYGLYLESPARLEGATVPVAIVTSRTEAELIVGMLRNYGLRAVVSADDAGGQDPALQNQGVRVLVAPSDEAAARQLLAAAWDSSGEAGHGTLSSADEQASLNRNELVDASTRARARASTGAAGPDRARSWW